jgi:multidrug transporter EmrE-like cation transporter
MSIEITALVLLAAALHAGWNGLIKISGDRVAAMAFVTLAGCLLSLFFLPFVDSPAPESWPLLALTILLHTGYHFFLPVAYDHGDLGQVYPIARGSAPILVTLGAILFAGELLEPLALASCLPASCSSLLPWPA